MSVSVAQASGPYVGDVGCEQEIGTVEKAFTPYSLEFRLVDGLLAGRI